MLFPHPQRTIKVIVLHFLLLAVLVACGIYPGTSREPLPSPLSALTSPIHTPTPLGYVEPTGTPTPTWDVNFDPDKVTPGPTWTPTATPIPIYPVGVWPRMFTYSFTIERADGRREIYIVPVGFVPMVRTESDRAIYEVYIQSLANLGPGDVYVGGCAASPWMIMVPPEMICYTKSGPPVPSHLLTPTPTHWYR